MYHINHIASLLFIIIILYACNYIIYIIIAYTSLMLPSLRLYNLI